MDGKRILPWEKKFCGYYVDEAVEVQTVIASYCCLRSGNKTTAWRTVGISNDPIGHTFPTLNAAMDACESDYIARCTEFLRLAGPGECVVAIRDLKTVIDDCEENNTYFDVGENDRFWTKGTEHVEDACLGLTAAIDAASKENER